MNPENILTYCALQKLKGIVPEVMGKLDWQKLLRECEWFHLEGLQKDIQQNLEPELTRADISLRIKPKLRVQD